VLRGDHKPPVYLLQQLLSFGDRYALLENARGAAVVELLFIPSKTNDLARRASRRASALSRGTSP
jgi:hypothetical protein